MKFFPKNFFSDVNKWGNESRKGLLCGIFGCNEPVEIRCNICKCGYCKKHMQWHFHSADNKGIFFK